uniref:RELB proto-oncogene, NF-kB subunit n=1 Tax=Cebus imitator TaxID=2715852 RepID=A0A2K5QL48_CEBIM
MLRSGRASGPSVSSGRAMPSRRVARPPAASELGALGSPDLSSLSLSVSRTTEIIDEYIKENGFGLDRAQPGPGEGLPRLVSRGAASLSTVTLGPVAPPATPPPWGCPLGRLVPPAPGPGPQPHLVITEQPKQRGMRFRYECEGRSAGSILGESSTEASKTLPAIELRDCGGLREVEVTACLVWKDWPHRVHPHSLVGKDCTDGVCRVRLRPHVSPRHSFNNLGIQCVRKKEIEAIQLGIDPYNAGSLKNHQEVDMNVVRICFQASYRDQQGQMCHMDPVLSEPVYDKKSTNTSELRICRINKESGPCTGGEELYLLCDKVQKGEGPGAASWGRVGSVSQEYATALQPGQQNESPFLPPSALLPDPDFFSGTVSLPGLEPPGGPDLLDDGFAYDPPPLLTMLDLLPPAPPHASAVVSTGGAGAVVGEHPGPEPLTLDSYQGPGPGDGGTASLVGSNMFPNQYREAAFGGGLMSPGPEAT